jgi:hypothetical protein
MRVVVVVCLVLFSSSARADDLAKVPDHEFGDNGQYVLTSDSRLDYTRATWTYDGMDHAQWRFTGRIAIDRAFFARFTAGLHIGYEADGGDDGSTKGVTLGGRLGHVLPLGRGAKVHLWPRAGLTYGNFTYLFDTASGPADATVQLVRVELSCPVVWNPVRRLLLGFGPFYWQEVFANVSRIQGISKTTTMGVQVVFGGWFHGY